VGPEASRESRCEFYNFLVGSQVQPSPWAMRPVERAGVSFITFWQEARYNHHRGVLLYRKMFNRQRYRLAKTAIAAQTSIGPKA